MSQLECQPDRTQLTKSTSIDLWVHQRDGSRGWVCNLVVVQNDHVDPFLIEEFDGIPRGRATINGKEHVRRILLKAFLNRHGTQAIAIIQSMRQVGLDVPAKLLHHFDQQRRRGHPVDIIVTENHHALPL